jgi:hypothetical protein
MLGAEEDNAHPPDSCVAAGDVRATWIHTTQLVVQ